MPRFALLLCLACLAQSAYADWYQVEVIVFRNIQPDVDGEFWGENPGLPDNGDSIQLLDVSGSATLGPAGEMVPYEALPASRYRLDGIERALKLSAEYRPLLHVAWQQPARGADRSRSVHLGFPPPPVTANAAVPATEDAAVSAVPLQDPVLDGTVRLRVGRFLHVDVDMVYFPDEMPAASPPPAAVPTGKGAASIRVPQAVPADYVRLRHTRKVLLNELHYIDHPLFGIIVQVTRVVLPEAVPAPQTGL